jgi:hypothetical protein
MKDGSKTLDAEELTKFQNLSHKECRARNLRLKDLKTIVIADGQQPNYG